MSDERRDPPRDDAARDDVASDDMARDDVARDDVASDDDVALDDAWKAHLDAALPPPGFAARVLAARRSEDESPRLAADARTRRGPLALVGALGVAAGLALALVPSALAWPSSGTHAPSTTDDSRAHLTTLALGRDASATVDEDALVAWRVDLLGRVFVTQLSGRALYRVTPGTDVVVTTPLGDAIVQGTVFSVAVTDDDTTRSTKGPHMLTELRPETHVFARGALLGAVMATAVVVTVYEGGVVVSSKEGSAVAEPGDRATIVPGQAPVLSQDDDAVATLTKERDQLARQVDALDRQLGALMAAASRGDDPVVVENARLKGELARVERALAAFVDEDERKRGVETPWPADVPEIFREAGVKRAIEDALRAAGVQGELTSLDCAEFPCTAYGEIVVEGGKEASARELEKFSRALDETYPESRVSRHDSIWGKSEKSERGTPRVRNHFAVSVFPDDIVDDATKKAIGRRVRARNQAYLESLIAP